MTEEDDEKLYAYVDKIKEDYGTVGFFDKNGFCVDDNEWNGDSEDNIKLVLHIRDKKNPEHYDVDKDIVIFRGFVECYDVDTKFSFQFLQYDQKTNEFSVTESTPKDYPYEWWEDIDEDEVNFEFLKKWIDYNLCVLSKSQKLAVIKQRIKDINKDFVK